MRIKQPPTARRSKWQRLADEAEYRTVGGGMMSRMRPIMLSDSAPIARDKFKIYHVRTAKLEDRSGKFGLSYKPSPVFAEMASPGSQFEGQFGGHLEKFSDDAVLKAFRWKEPVTMEALATAANRFARQLLETESLFANRAGLAGSLTSQISNPTESTAT